jgi:hypothetical protein
VAANDFGHDPVQVLKALLDESRELSVTNGVWMEAATSASRGFEMMKVLLHALENGPTSDNRHLIVRYITEDVWRGAAENRGHGLEIIGLLLDSVASDAPISERLVLAACSNFIKRLEILMLLYGRPEVHRIAISEPMIIEAVRRQHLAADIAFLIDRWDDDNDVTISENLVVRAAGDGCTGSDILALLRERFGYRLPIVTENVIAAALSTTKPLQVLEELDQWPSDQGVITEKIVTAGILHHGSAQDILVALTHRCEPHTVVDESIMVAMANHPHGEALMQVLFERWNQDAVVTENTVVAAAGNVQGEPILKLLFDKGDEDVIVSESAVTAALSHGSREAVRRLFCERRGKGAIITDHLLVLAAQEYESAYYDADYDDNDVGEGEDVVKTLWKEIGESTALSEDVAMAAAASTLDLPMKVLLQRSDSTSLINERIVRHMVVQRTERIEKAGQEVDMFLQLTLEALDKDCHNITDVLSMYIQLRECEEQGRGDARRLAEFLREEFERILDRPLPPMEDEFWSVAPPLPMTISDWTTAAEDPSDGPRELRILLRRTKGDVPASDGLLLTACSRKKQAPEVLALLLKHMGQDPPVTDRTVKSACANAAGAELVSILKKHVGDKLPVTDSVLKSACRNDVEGAKIMALFLEHLGVRLPVTENVVKTACEQSKIVE